MTENQKIVLRILKNNIIWFFPRVLQITLIWIFTDWFIKAISAGDFFLLAFTLLFLSSILILTVAGGTFLEYSFYKKRGKFWEE